MAILNCNCYLNPNIKCPHFDMTDLPRIVIREDMTPAEKEFFQGYNDQCERVEDLWIELDLQAMDQMEAASKKLAARNAKQRERDNRNDVLQLHKQGFTLAEIASITKLDHKEIYDFIHSKKKSSTLFDDCPAEIMGDLAEEFDLQ